MFTVSFIDPALSLELEDDQETAATACLCPSRVDRKG
jgi:hypothetical protein